MGSHACGVRNYRPGGSNSLFFTLLTCRNKTGRIRTQTINLSLNSDLFTKDGSGLDLEPTNLDPGSNSKPIKWFGIRFLIDNKGLRIYIGIQTQFWFHIRVQFCNNFSEFILFWALDIECPQQFKTNSLLPEDSKNITLNSFVNLNNQNAEMF